MMPPSATAYRMKSREFFQLPEGPPYFQLIDGDLYMSPSPRRYHQQISMRLSLLLGNFIEDHGLGELYAAPSDVMLADDTVLEPDLYFVSLERAGILTEQGAAGAPDLVIEILSPSTAIMDLGRKREIYTRSGVREMWVIAPETRTIEIYHFAGGAPAAATIVHEGETITSSVLQGFTAKAADVFDN
jgi:Uma2 family endonuclease